MVKILLLSILSLSFLGCGHETKKDDKTRAHLHFKIGTGHLAKGNYPLALKELLNAHRLDPNDPLIHNNLGLAYMVRNKYADASRHMKQAVVIDPKYTDARNNLGRVLIERGLFAEAQKELQIASEDLTYTNPQKVWANLGLAHYRQKNYNSALKSFKKALSLQRNNCITYNWYSRTLYELKKYSRAAESYDKAIRLCKKRKLDEPHYYGALSYYKIGRSEEAIARLEEVIEFYPNGKFVNKAKSLLKTIK